MQKLLSGLLVLGLAFTLGVGTTGCKKGTANNGGGNRTGGGGDGNITYKLEADAVNLRPNGSATVTVTRSGPKEKLTEQAVEAKFEGDNPSKLKVDEVKFNKEETQAKIIIKAPGDATPGKGTLHVKVGNIDAKVTVTVEKAEGGDGDGKGKNQKTTYKFEPAETTKVAAGKTVEIKITREGGSQDAQAIDAKVEGNDKVSIDKVTKFEAKGTDATVTVKVDPKATGEANVKITIGDHTHNVKITIDKKGASLQVPSRHLALGTRQAEVLPEARVSVRRDLVLFIREL